MIRLVHQRATLVTRLRRPVEIIDDLPDPIALTEKVDAIGEALAYLVDRRWTKQKQAKAKRKGG